MIFTLFCMLFQQLFDVSVLWFSPSVWSLRYSFCDFVPLATRIFFIGLTWNPLLKLFVGEMPLHSGSSPLLLISPVGVWGKQALTGYQLGALYVEVFRWQNWPWSSPAKKDLQWSDKNSISSTTKLLKPLARSMFPEYLGTYFPSVSSLKWMTINFSEIKNQLSSPFADECFFFLIWIMMTLPFPREILTDSPIPQERLRKS